MRLFPRSLTLDQTDFLAVPGADFATDFVTATFGMQGALGTMRTDFGATAVIGTGDGVELSAFFGMSLSF